jgi:hypothetical protein
MACSTAFTSWGSLCQDLPSGGLPGPSGGRFPRSLLQSSQLLAGVLWNDNRETVVEIEGYLPAFNGNTPLSFVLRRKP